MKNIILFFTNIYILQLEEFSVLGCYYQRISKCKILNSNCFEAFLAGLYVSTGRAIAVTTA